MRRLSLSLAILGLAISVMLWPVGAQVQIIPALQGGPMSGTTGTFSGAVTASGTVTANSTAAAQLVINNPTADASVVGTSYQIFQTATATRWYLGMSPCAADGAFGLYNGINAGCAISVSKAATSPVTLTGTVDAAGYKVSTAAITSGTTFLTSGSGMAVANVGANSCGTSAASIAGNNNVSVITVGATAGTQCRIAFTFAATTEWDCVANDDTTTVAVRTTPVDTTHTDIIGTFTAADKVTAICFPR